VKTKEGMKALKNKNETNLQRRVRREIKKKRIKE
jgi:hypothetical protein